MVVRGHPVPVLSFLNDPRFEERINTYASASEYFKLSSIDALSEITFYEQGLHLEFTDEFNPARRQSLRLKIESGEPASTPAPAAQFPAASAVA